MTYYADLTPYAYLAKSEDLGSALNVGWLDRAHEFPQGPVPADFVESLAGACVKRQMNLTRGWHRCNLDGCTHPDRPVARAGDTEETLGSAEMRATGKDGRRYAAPAMIHHYVVEHGYRPPDEFIAAVRGR